MAPLITTSLREYALHMSRAYQQRADRTKSLDVMLCATTTRDEWLGVHDWTESAYALQPFDDLMDSLNDAIKTLDAYVEKHDLQDAANHPLNNALFDLDIALDQAEDCRSIITNVRRKDGAT